ncbi:MAG: hypothetical protein P1P88_10195 [Bacteroidales bacterium]|nr:hypothetical protein [Bacteroidales bacterium]
MKKLKKFVDENRMAFDELELPVGHENRFRKKLHKRKSSVGLKIWYGVAASFIFLAMLSFFARGYLFENRFIKENPQVIGLSDISPKYQEVEEFYQAGVIDKINEIESLNCKINDEQKSMINSELEQLNGSYKNLQAELKNNRNDERIINAMIDNYQNRIRFLELVINQIKQNC